MNKNKHPTPLRRRDLLFMGSLSFLGASCQRKSIVERTKYIDGIYYRVKKGDTLHNIAECCGISVQKLISSNYIESKELYLGQILFLPQMSHVPDQLTQENPSARDEEDSSYKSWQRSSVPDLETEPYESGLQIVKRQEWGAAPSKSNSTRMGKVKRITLHHTSEYQGMNSLSDKRVISAIANYHRNTLGWADIGYHFLIGRDGKIYEGRPSILQGAHTGGHNENNLGISMIGNFMHRLPSSQQLSALKKLLAEKFKVYKLSTKNLYGHRDFKPTECPGEALYSWLKTYKLNS